MTLRNEPTRESIDRLRARRRMTDQGRDLDDAYPDSPPDPAAEAAERERFAKWTRERHAAYTATCAHRWIADSGKTERYCVVCLMKEVAVQR